MAAAAANDGIKVVSFERRKPARRPPAGEDATETLELIPRQWKVIQHVREKVSCRACETIAQPPAPSHPIARGRAGPKLLAHILFSKYGLRPPLNRQSTAAVREGINLDVSTLADWVGACAATLMPLVEAILVRVFAASASMPTIRPWDALTRFLDDGRLCMSNNAAERALRGIAVGRRNWTSGSRHLHVDRNCQAQRHRPAGLSWRGYRIIPPGTSTTFTPVANHQRRRMSQPSVRGA
jgi:transposase